MSLATRSSQTRQDRLDPYLKSEAGQIRLNVPDGLLPDFLVQAFNAMVGGRLPQAMALLTPDAMMQVDQAVETDQQGGLLASLLVAMILQRQGELEAALHRYETIQTHDPHPLVLNELSRVCTDLGRSTEALAWQEQALALNPDDVELEANVALRIIGLGRVTEGLERLRCLVKVGKASPSVHSSFLWCSHYELGNDAHRQIQDRKRWAQQHAPGHLAWSEFTNDPDPDRCLRVGFLSSDFCVHSVAYNFEAILDGCDPDRVCLYGYGHVLRPDQMTRRLAEKFATFRFVHSMDDRTLAEQIRADRIDILVPLAGHTTWNRLTALAYKPAPVIADSGALGTLGMPQVDYKITDPWLNPEPSQSQYVERFIYLDHGYLCYRAPDWMPQVNPLPALSNGWVTFGSFNNHLKISAETLSLWCAVLRACPTSRLYLKNKAGVDPAVREGLIRRFNDAGITPERVTFVPWDPDLCHTKHYHQVDIALDTYPFNGCVTSLEAMWMGVPVVTLCGDTLPARVGHAIWNQLGQPGFVTHTRDDFVTKAVALARNLEVLAKLRANLRVFMQASPLCDAQRYANELQQAFRTMWRLWCAQQQEG